MKTPHPEVSVIISTYNRIHYLKQAVDSVLSQTFTNWECLICDDCSTDATSEYCKSLCKKDKRFRYLCKVHWGFPAGPRNMGIANSNGRWIAFLDDDDSFHPEKLNIQVEYMRLNNIGFTACKGIGFYQNKPFIPGKVKQPDFNLVDYNPYLEPCKILCSSVVMINRTYLTKSRFDESKQWKAVEDWKLWMELFSQKISFKILEGPPLVGYRIDNPDSISIAFDHRHHEKVSLYWLQLLADFEGWAKMGYQRQYISPLLHKWLEYLGFSLYVGDFLTVWRGFRLLRKIFYGENYQRPVIGLVKSFILNILTGKWRFRISKPKPRTNWVMNQLARHSIKAC